MNGTNSFPIWFLIRFVRWSLILSSEVKSSFSRPKISLSSFTPISRFPPDVFRNAVIVFRTAFSIFLSKERVCRFFLRVDLNSILEVSPIFRMSCIISCVDLAWSFGPKNDAFFSRARARKFDVKIGFFDRAVL